MAPIVSKKRKSLEQDSKDDPPRDGDDGSRTPLGSPLRKRPRITQSQKQALMDNLQLEITERARKLRAHYALQAQDLRGRIERRVNRIPIALRKATMGELLAKHAEAATVGEASIFKKPTLPSKATKSVLEISKDMSDPSDMAAAAASTRIRGVKRTSDDLLSSDKENVPCLGEISPPLSNPKKRTKPNAAGRPRVVSHLAESKILSPKSSNSRTFPQSPLRSSPPKTQQQQSHLACSVSTLKPRSHIKAATASLAGIVENARARTTRGVAAAARKISPTRKTRATSQTKKTTAKSATSAARKAATTSASRPATRQHYTRQVSSSTTTSSASCGTMIVRPTRTAAVARKAATAAGISTTMAAKNASDQKAQAPTATSAAKRSVAAVRSAELPNAPAPGRRILRKRG